MAFSISPQVNIYETEATSLAVPFSGETVGAMAGITQWGAVLKPINITRGYDEFLEKFFPPVEKSLTSFYIAKDYLRYSQKMSFVRVVGKNARNASFRLASDLAVHSKVSISADRILNIVDTTSEANATVDLTVDGTLSATQVTDQNGNTTFQIEVPEGKQIVYMRLTKVD